MAEMNWTMRLFNWVSCSGPTDQPTPVPVDGHLKLYQTTGSPHAYAGQTDHGAVRESLPEVIGNDPHNEKRLENDQSESEIQDRSAGAGLSEKSDQCAHGSHPSITRGIPVA